MAAVLSFDSDDIGNITVCSWFRTSETDGSNNWALFDFDRSEYFNLYVEGDGDIGWSTSSSGSVDDLFDAGSYNDGNWHHVCGLYNGDKQILVNGTVTASQNNPHGTLGSGALRYGIIGEGSEADDYGKLKDPSNGGQRNEQYYDGTVDDVRFYERALSSVEIERLWAFAGGAPDSYETDTRQFADSVNLSNLLLENVEATTPTGTSIKIQVEADTDGDGTFEKTSGNVTLDGSGTFPDIYSCHGRESNAMPLILG